MPGASLAETAVPFRLALQLSPVPLRRSSWEGAASGTAAYSQHRERSGHVQQTTSWIASGTQSIIVTIGQKYQPRRVRKKCALTYVNVHRFDSDKHLFVDVEDVQRQTKPKRHRGFRSRRLSG